MTNASRTRVIRIAAPCAACLLVLGAWQLVCTLDLVPSFMLPSPLDVARALVVDGQLLASHAGVTLLEALAGLAAGIVLGFALAVAMERFRLVDAALSPIVTISQTIPVVAVAPLLVLWFGYGMLPKVLLVALTTFFPITVALASGFKSVDPDAVDLMRTMGASRWQVFRFAQLPAAAGSFFTGLRISATYAVIGAVVAEWLGGFQGLGVYMTRVRKSYDYDSLFAAIVVVAAVSLALLGATKALERACMPWRRVRRQDRGEGRMPKAEWGCGREGGRKGGRRGMRR